MTSSYTPVYGADEVAEVVVDAIVEFGVQFFLYMAIVVIVVLYIWVRRKKVMPK